MCVMIEVEVEIEISVIYQSHFLDIHFVKALIPVDILINHVHFDVILSALRLKLTLILCIFSQVPLIFHVLFCILSIF